MTTNKTGSCLCGAVKYEVTGPLRPVIACHCTQCRKQTGTYMSATAAKETDWHLTETRGLKWYRSSDTAQRGFCAECGSVLFWRGDGRDYTAIAAGSIDGETGLNLAGHIFCDDAGDYYEIAGGEFQQPQSSSNLQPQG
ncbi:GFA family protein [soil metagenome]